MLGDVSGNYASTAYDMTAGTIEGFSLVDDDGDGDVDIEIETTGGTALLVNDGNGSFTLVNP